MLDPPEEGAEIPKTPENWVRLMFPHYVGYPFAQRHLSLLQWAWNIKKGIRSRPYVAVWPREGGKTTLAELVTVMLGSRNQRSYAVYVRRTQEKADESVSNIATMLESSTIDLYYPNMGKREIGKFGNARDWRRERLRTQTGWTLDALGLDSAFRGAKIKNRRPDFFILPLIKNHYFNLYISFIWVA